MRDTYFISEIMLIRIASGDRDAFRSFYDIIYPQVYRFIHYFLPNKADCEEVVSDVFFIFWKEINSLLDIKDLKAWIYIVCRNEAYHYLKQKEKNSNISIDDMPVELLIDRNNVEGEMIEEEMLDVYNGAVSELPERCKLVFLMIREERLKHKEVARILSITEGTVEQQMNIAIRKIVETVKKYYPSLSFNDKKSEKQKYLYR